MILSKYVDVVISGTNLKHFEDLGYTIPRHKDSKGRVAIKKGTKINVEVGDLLPSSSVLIEVQCEDCGEKRRVQYADIAYRKNSRFAETGETLCSNCANHRTKGESNPNYKHGCNKYCEYRRNARRRGYDFNLSIDEFKKLTSQKCYYCGSDGKVGIDRLDPQIGYSIKNCVPCCRLCNRTKATMNYEEFIGYIKALYNNLIKNEI